MNANINDPQIKEPKEKYGIVLSRSRTCKQPRMQERMSATV